MLPRLRFPALNGSVDASALLMHDYRLHKLEESSPDLLGLSVGLSPKYPTVVDKALVLEGESQALDISKDMGQLLEEFHKCFASLNNDRSISPERLELFMRAVHDGLESTDVDVFTGEVSRDVLLQDIRMRLLRSMQDFSAFCTYFLGSPENLAAFERMIATHASTKTDASSI